VLAGRGLIECVTFSFLPSAQARLFGGGQKALLLANPISSDLDCMRPSVLPNLIAAAGRNMDRGFYDAALFEVGPAYADTTADGQSRHAAGIRIGHYGPRHWAAPRRLVDAFDAKADVFAVLAALGIRVDKTRVETTAPAWYHPGRSGVIQLGPKTRLAAFGEIHPAVLDEMDVKGPCVGFEIFVDALPRPKTKGGPTRSALQVSDLQAVERDFAFVVDQDVAAARLVQAAGSADPKLITDVSVFDVYEGEHVGAGRKSIAISVRLEPTERTLRDEEIDAIADKVVSAVREATGGELRG
jgi:phenylalanyl-tRNA synthetase beta chain